MAAEIKKPMGEMPPDGIKRRKNEREQRELLKKGEMLQWAGVGMAVLSAASILAVGLTGRSDTGLTAAAYVVAVLFWLGIILEQVFLWQSRKCRKMYEEMKELPGGAKSPPGILAFFRNREAKVADIVTAVAIVAVLIVWISGTASAGLILGSVGLVFLSFNMHCILNGENYRFYKEEKGGKGVYA